MFNVAYFYSAGGGSKYLTGCLKLLTVGHYSETLRFPDYFFAFDWFEEAASFDFICSIEVVRIMNRLTRKIFHDFGFT